MRPNIVPCDIPGAVGYFAPDGSLHRSIAAAVRHVQSGRPVPNDSRPVPAPIVAPVAVCRAVVRPTVTVVRADCGIVTTVVRVVARRVIPDVNPLAVLADLKRDLRRAEAELSAVPTIAGAPNFSAAYRYNVALRSHYSGRVDTIKRAITRHRREHWLPELRIKPWKLRPESLVDRRASLRWLSVASATPLGWTVPDLSGRLLDGTTA